MNKTLRHFFVSALMVLVCITLVACGNNAAKVDNNVPLGSKYPNSTGTQKLNSTLSALQMYEIGVKNYNKADFAASRQLADITTESMLGTMNQYLDSLKIQQDKKYYLDLYTFTTAGSPNIKIADQSIYQINKETGKYEYKVRSVDKKNNIVVDKKNKECSVKNWPTPKTFASLKAGLKQFPNDPTRVNMYIVNSNTVKSSTKPEYDAKNKTYTFELVLDVETATVDYLENMKYQTKKGGVSGATITFTRLKLNVVMWDNGLFKTITSDEAYNVTAKVMGIESKNSTELLGTTYFTYDRSEINIDDYIKF